MWEGCQVLWNKKLLTPLEQDLGYLLKYTVVLTEDIAVYRKNGQKFTWDEFRIECNYCLYTLTIQYSMDVKEGAPFPSEE